MDYTKNLAVSENFAEFEAIRRADGSWHDRDSLQPLPGARDMTAAEFLGPSASFHSKMGEWVDVPGDAATLHPQILEWCWNHSNSGSSVAGFRFERRVFEEAGHDTFPIAYIPELHDEREHIRSLAWAERNLRAARAKMDRLERQRAQCLVAAASHGCTRRKLAEFVGLSFARVQQLIAERDKPPPPYWEQVVAAWRQEYTAGS